jgi:two-component system sensor histidine kinase YesM
MLRKSLEKIPWNSIRFKLLTGVALFLIPISMYLYYNNIYSAGVLRAQAAEQHKKLVNIYMEVVENDLNYASSLVIDLVNNNYDLYEMEYIYQLDENQKQLAKSSVYRTISNDITQCPYIDGIFVYSLNNNDIMHVSSDSSSYESDQALNEYLKKSISSQSLKIDSKNFIPIKIDEKYYLIRIFSNNGIYAGVWVSANHLSNHINQVNKNDQVTTLFSTSDGNPMVNENFIQNNHIELTGKYNDYYITGGADKYLVVGQESTAGPFNLFMLIPEKELLANLMFLHYIGYGLILFSIIFIVPLYILFLKKVVLNPLWKIYVTINRVNKGNLDARIEDFKSSSEMVELKNTFNKMMDEIKGLKISVYEEKIGKQKEELENLKLRINPHFILNSLHIIYSLAQVKDFKLIQEMSLCLSKYFGFITRGNKNFVVLSEEIDQLKNYIRIHELRFPGIFTYEINVEEDLLKVPVPSLVLQTFVENTFKYALNMENPIHLAVNIQRKDEEHISLSVSNTGEWIKEDILEQLRSGKRILKEDGEHVGIWNIRRRLDLIYDGQAQIKFSNLEPKGVEIEVIIPNSNNS